MTKKERRQTLLNALWWIKDYIPDKEARGYFKRVYRSLVKLDGTVPEWLRDYDKPAKYSAEFMSDIPF